MIENIVNLLEKINNFSTFFNENWGDFWTKNDAILGRKMMRFLDEKGCDFWRKNDTIFG